MNTSFDANINWYELWMQQSKIFFETTEQYLKDFFEKGKSISPEDHLKQVNEWLEILKKQWEIHLLTEKQKTYQTYWNMMSKLYGEASDLMLNEWIKRTKAETPIQSTRALYELWLHCCNEVYQKAMNSKDYQTAWGQWLNGALQFWAEGVR